MRGYLLLLIGAPVLAQNPAAEFFERKIRPVLVTQCFGCHSAKVKTPMGGLALDRRDGLARVAANGKLMGALRYGNPQLQMPPSGKLPEAVIADFAAWVEAGAHDPRPEQEAVAQARPAVDWRTWWAFQPLKEAVGAPAQGRIDYLVRARLEANGLALSPEPDVRGDQSSLPAGVAVSGLGDRGGQRRRILSPVCRVTTGGGPDSRNAAEGSAGAGGSLSGDQRVCRAVWNQHATAAWRGNGFRGAVHSFMRSMKQGFGWTGRIPARRPVSWLVSFARRLPLTVWGELQLAEGFSPRTVNPKAGRLPNKLTADS